MLKLLLTISLFAAAQAVGNCGESEGVALCVPSTVTVSLHIEQTTMFRRANLFYSILHYFFQFFNSTRHHKQLEIFTPTVFFQTHCEAFENLVISLEMNNL